MMKIIEKIKDIWRNNQISSYAIIIIALCFVLLFLNNCQRPKTETEIITHTDTIYKTETIYVKVNEPVEVIRYKDRFFRDTIIVKDTVKQAIDIPMERVTYEDSLYKAILSGYKPRIESMEIYAPHTTIETNTEQIITKYRNDYSRWSLGVSGGYAITNNGLSPYIGVGINYDVLRWRKRK